MGLLKVVFFYITFLPKLLFVCIFKPRFFFAALRGAKIQSLKEAEQDGPAIDVELYDLVEKSTVKLFDFTKTNRPLVLNFGSCTWPPFMANVKKFGALCGEFSDVADFVTVYISEGLWFS